MNYGQTLALIYASLIGWRHHPGYRGRGVTPPSLEQLLEEALEATTLLHKTFGRKPPWLDGQQQDQPPQE